MDVNSELPFVHLNEPLLRSIQKRINKDGQKHKSIIIVYLDLNLN